MKVSLILQCINTWNFSWLKNTDKVEVFINDVPFPHVVKDRGCRIIMEPPKPLPPSYHLKVLTKSFLPFESLVCDSNLHDDRIFPIELIPSIPPFESEARIVTAPLTVVCGYDYYTLCDDCGVLSKGSNRLKIKNPRFENIEGRRFLLRDTESRNEEFVIVGDAVDFKLCEYKIPPLMYDYSVKSTALLPAFCVIGEGERNIFVKRFSKPAKLWIYE